MQLVQTSILVGRPLTITSDFWMFGIQRRLVRRFEWLTLWPNCGPLPQIEHFAMILLDCAGSGPVDLRLQRGI